MSTMSFSKVIFHDIDNINDTDGHEIKMRISIATAPSSSSSESASRAKIIAAAVRRDPLTEMVIAVESTANSQTAESSIKWFEVLQEGLSVVNTEIDSRASILHLYGKQVANIGTEEEGTSVITSISASKASVMDAANADDDAIENGHMNTLEGGQKKEPDADAESSRDNGDENVDESTKAIRNLLHEFKLGINRVKDLLNSDELEDLLPEEFGLTTSHHLSSTQLGGSNLRRSQPHSQQYQEQHLQSNFQQGNQKSSPLNINQLSVSQEASIRSSSPIERKSSVFQTPAQTYQPLVHFGQPINTPLTPPRLTLAINPAQRPPAFALLSPIAQRPADIYPQTSKPPAFSSK